MSDLGDLYQQVILDHNRNPRNFKRVDAANRRAEGHNPLCGDRIQLYVQLDGDAITDIGFQMPQGSGARSPSLGFADDEPSRANRSKTGGDV